MAKQKTRKNRSFIVSFCIVALCAYFAISLFSISKEISNKKAEIAAVQTATTEQNKKNNELRKVVDGGNIDEYAESLARDKYGYVMPGERVYYDISVNG